MARRQYRTRAKAAYSRGRSYASRGYGYGKRAYAKSGLNLNLPFMGGVVAAFAVPQNTDLDMAAIMVAAAPVKGLGKVKGAAQGYIFGQALQHWLLPKAGVNIPDFAGNILGSRAVNSGNYI